MDLARMRYDYEARGLHEGEVAADPLEQFETWLGEAVAAELAEPNAFVLATLDADGRPWSRHLLLKGLSEGGFEFYTNYTSDKGQQLADDSRVAVTFGWLGLNRQVNITGSCGKVSEAESEAYFAKRPRSAQLGAWASDQSTLLSDRSGLEAAYAVAEERFPDAVPRPSHWGGYRILPETIEFWQGNRSRLHDRLRYTHTDGAWPITRRNP